MLFLPPLQVAGAMSTTNFNDLSEILNAGFIVASIFAFRCGTFELFGVIVNETHRDIGRPLSIVR